MTSKTRADHKIKVLIVTPEITYLPPGMGNIAERLSAKAGGLADVSASLVSALYNMGVDVHVALPNYRRLFHVDVQDLMDAKLSQYRALLGPDANGRQRIHLAEDRAFYYREHVYSNYAEDSLKMSLTFQREVINNIIPAVLPDLIHCNDWMTGLVPGLARRWNIPALFTVHNIHTQETTLETIENYGIDTAFFWQNLYYARTPACYEESRSTNLVDLLTSGIFGAHFVNTVSPTFLQEIVEGQHAFVPPQIQREIANKFHAGCAMGILNAPDPDYHPGTDKALAATYQPDNHAANKALNKKAFQDKTGLTVNADAPLLFWPSRLDPIQKGPQLLAEILYQVIHDYWDLGLQVAIVAEGAFQGHFRAIADQHGLHRRIAVCPFQESLSRLGYAAADYILMPSRFEPCGLPQMIGPLYGSLPIVHDTGGLHDTVTNLDVERHTGNGFVFKYYDAGGLRWAIDEAMRFHDLPARIRQQEVARVMQQAATTFTHANTAAAYVRLYEKMLQRPLLPNLAEDTTTP
ncbi:MAG: glycogen/starch synthase [Lentisphaeria bacterium]|jgi:ADP-glucose type glycogen/starch synthase|nr:glycogen/starch synthase [Lentisphaeria bacterium]